MAAVVEGQNRGSLTSLPDMLDRATRLYDVLSTGRTTSMMATSQGFPDRGPESRATSRAPSSGILTITLIFLYLLQFGNRTDFF